METFQPLVYTNTVAPDLLVDRATEELMKANLMPVDGSRERPQTKHIDGLSDAPLISFLF